VAFPPRPPAASHTLIDSDQLPTHELLASLLEAATTQTGTSGPSRLASDNTRRRCRRTGHRARAPPRSASDSSLASEPRAAGRSTAGVLSLASTNVVSVRATQPRCRTSPLLISRPRSSRSGGLAGSVIHPGSQWAIWRDAKGANSASLSRRARSAPASPVRPGPREPRWLRSLVT
jgi:hypothetical protein